MMAQIHRFTFLRENRKSFQHLNSTFKVQVKKGHCLKRAPGQNLKFDTEIKLTTDVQPWNMMVSKHHATTLLPYGSKKYSLESSP